MDASSPAVTVHLSPHNGGRDWIAVDADGYVGIGPTPAAAVAALWEVQLAVRQTIVTTEV